MIYGNGLSSDFIGSGVGVPVDESVNIGVPPTRPVYTLPIIKSLSGLHSPNHVDNALFAVKIGMYTKNENSSALGPYVGDYTNCNDPTTMLETLSASYTYSKDELSLDAFHGEYLDKSDIPHRYLYLCQNWWKFASYSNDDMSHMFNYSGAYGGYSEVHLSAWKGLKGYKTVVPNNGVTYRLEHDDKSKIILEGNTMGMPGYMGAAMIFSTTSTFNENKLIGVGFKGLGWTDPNNSHDYLHKLYRFTDADGYFKSLGNNMYLFNDPEIVNVKGHVQPIQTPPYTPRENHYFYSGPCFIKGTYNVGTYGDSTSSTKQSKMSIGISDFIASPIMESSISYLSVNRHYDDMLRAKPIDALISFGGYSASCHVKVWKDTANDMIQYESKTYGPQIPYSDTGSWALSIGTKTKELFLGKCLAGYSSFYKTQANSSDPDKMTNLVAIHGSWKDGVHIKYGIYDFFHEATSLKTIPSSWEGLDKIITTTGDQLFYNCHSLTAVPSSFNHFGTKSLTTLRSAFANCYSLVNGLKSWENLDNVSATDSMCTDCYSLTAIPDNFNHLGSVTSCTNMFYKCYALKEIKSWQGINKIENGSNMFQYCYSLSAIPSTWDGINGKFYAPYMFGQCYGLKTIPKASEWARLFSRIDYDYSTGVFVPDIFFECTGLSGTVKEILDVFIQYNVQGQGQFYHCSGFSDYFTCLENPSYAPYL